MIHGLSKVAEMEQGTRRFQYLDGLRGIACLIVVVYHYLAVLAPFAAIAPYFSGTYAVSIFFLLSGFVLTRQARTSPARLLESFRGRVVRIAIPTWCALALSIVMMACGHGLLPAAIAVTHSPYMPPTFFQPSAAGIAHDLSGFSIVAGFKANQIMPFPGSIYQIYSTDPVVWTISFEIWGSLLVLLLCRMPGALYPLAACSGALLLGPHMSLFALGSLVSTYRGRLTARAPLWIGYALILMATVLFFKSPHWSAIALFWGVVLCAPLHRFLTLRPALYAGRISFAVYLLHFPLLMGGVLLIYLHLRAVLGAWTIGVTMIVGFGLTIILAHLFTEFVDIPAAAMARAMRGAPSRKLAGASEALPAE